MSDARTRFRHLHDEPLRLPNAWSATSARLHELAGAHAIATTSAGIAYDNGYPDGERMPWEMGRRIAEEIIQAVGVPVTVDIESGYGATADAVAATVADVVAIGAAGINLEDSLPESGALRDPGAAAERVSAARAVSPDLFVNARCDVFLTGPASAEALAEAIRRAQAYAAAGADGIFLPGLLDLAMLERVTAELAIPVNVMVDPGAPLIDQLVAVGVRRFSQGIWAFRAMAAEVQRLAADFVVDGSYGSTYGTAPALSDLVRR